MNRKETCLELLKSEIEKKGEIQLNVHGNSMFPFLEDGDYVTVKKFDKLNVGDVVAYITYTDRINIIIHRIILIRKSYILTKGDNNDFVDPLKVTYDMIMGKI